MNATPFTPSFVGATGQYPIFEYVDSSSNSNYLYSSNSSNDNYGYSLNLKSEIESLKQKDTSHDSSISSINSTIGTIQGEVAANTTAIAGQAAQITTLEATTAANTTAITANTGAIVDLNLNKVNKSSFASTGLIYMDVAGNVQLSYDNTAFSQYSVITGNASVMTLNDTYKNLPTSISSINTNLNNNYFNKDQLSNVFITSNIHSNSLSNLTYQTTTALGLINNNVNNNYLTKNDSSNIFITTFYHSYTSNILANYNNLYNRPDIYTKTQIDTNFYNKSQINNFNTYKPMTSNITLKLTGSISELSLMDGGSGYPPNLTNQPLTFTKGGGQNASGTYNTDASGSVSSVSLTNGGILYTSTLVEVKAGTGNAVIVATMGYFEFHNVYSALNVSGKPDIVYERADLAFGTRNPNIINYLESPDGSSFTMATNNYCGLRVKDDRAFLISNSNMIISSFNNSYIYATSNVKLTSDTSDIILTCVNQYGKIKMRSDTIFEKQVSFNGSVSKKIPKYFTTSRIANFDGIPCLAFDINLQTNGVNLTNIESYTFRLFKIYFWFINKAPRYQWTPRSYEITMSNFDADSVSAFDGFGSYSSLDKAYSYQWFLYRQNFSQISFCCPTSLFGSTHLTVGYVIQDLLAE